MAFNKENKITWEELAPSLQELFKGLQTQITKEVERAKSEETRIEGRLNAEINRAKAEERRLQGEIDDIWGSDGKNTSHDITEIWAKLGELGDALDDLEDSVDSNMSIAISKGVGIRNSLNGRPPQAPGEWEINVREFTTADAKSSTQATLKQLGIYVVAAPAQTFTVGIDTGMIPYGFASAAQHAVTGDSVSISNLNYMGYGSIVRQELQEGYEGNPWGYPKGHHLVILTITGPWAVGDPVIIAVETIGYVWLNNFSKDPFPEYDINALPAKIAPLVQGDVYSPAEWASKFVMF